VANLWTKFTAFGRFAMRADVQQKRRPPLMKFYCGIDLRARDCHVCVINEQLRVMVKEKLRDELPKICQVLEPYESNH
jgi:hypothetical protein